jgi:hypothetical protein
MNRLCLALFVGLGAAPALAADYSVSCDLGPVGVANFSLFATSNGIPHFKCQALCSATDGTGAQVQFASGPCTFGIDSSDSNTFKCPDNLYPPHPPYSNPNLVYLGSDPCPLP